MSESKILLVIPAYNESERLPGFLSSLRRDAGCVQGVAFQYLVVDDGSTTEESQKMESICREFADDGVLDIRYLRLEKNAGKGAAVYAGWDFLESGPTIGFVDADGSVPVREIYRLAKHAMALRENAFFASRVKMLGREIRREWQRHLMGRVFATLIGIFIDSRVYDSQCGLKFIPKSEYLKIRPLLKEKGFAFDVELMAALQYSGVRIHEMPIDWQETAGSKVSLLRDSFHMIRAVLRISRERKTWPATS